MNSTAIVRAIAGALLVLAGMLCFIFIGEIYRAHVLLFAAVWCAVPILSLSLLARYTAYHFTEEELRAARVGFMIYMCFVSFSLLFGFDTLRNYVGSHYVEGYKYWRGDSDIDDNGTPVYLGDNWTTANNIGRHALNALHTVCFVGCFLFPYITFKCFSRTIDEKESQRLSEEANPCPAHQPAPD